MVAVAQLDPPALSTPDAPFPTGVTTGPLGSDDRLATDEELASALRSLEVITRLTPDDLAASDTVRRVHASLVVPALATHSLEDAHAFFGNSLRGHGGQTRAAYLHRALGQVSHMEQPTGSNHTKYNDWFAGLYGSVYHACAWCAIFQCWVGQGGAIPAAKRSAGARALVSNFPSSGKRVGSLIYYTFDHVEVLAKMDVGDYVFTVGGNTSDNGMHPDGVWYVRRNLSGIVGAYGMPDYTEVAPPHDHQLHDGSLAATGVFGHYTINHLKRALNHKYVEPRKSKSVKPLPYNGLFHRRTIKALQGYLRIAQTGECHTPTVRALQRHLKVTVDGDWGPKTTLALQHRLNTDTF